MHLGKKTTSPSKKYPPSSFMGKLKKRRIIETIIAFIAGGVAAVEFVYHILVHNYHFPNYTTDITIVVILLAMLCTLCWRWFRREKDEEKEEPKAEPISFPEWKNSIVVLPFDNISPEEGQDYFCDGMTEEIITDLSKIHSLRVISRGSAMTFKGTKKKISAIAKDVNVQYVLEGSVRKEGNNLRITAQLIEAAKDIHLWAEKYSGTLDDVFDIQEKVSRSIVDALKLKLAPSEMQKIVERPIDNVQAYECYLKAQYELYRFKEEALDRAIQHLETGLDIIGENATLYASMGCMYWQYYNIANKPKEEYLDKAEFYARKVFEIEPDSSHGHALQGLIAFFRGNQQEMVLKSKKAYEINPNDSDTLFMLSLALFYCGKTSFAEQVLNKFIEFDPLNPVYQALEALVNYMKEFMN